MLRASAICLVGLMSQCAWANSSFSMDGQWTVFAARRLLGHSILISSPDGSARTVLFTAPDKSALAPAWSPDGRCVAFSLEQFFQKIKGAALADIVMIGADGTGLKVLTDGQANYGFASWSGDGRQIVYRESAGNNSALKILDVASGENRILISGSVHYNFPGWSPTRNLIAFTADTDGDDEIYTIKPDGSELRRLTSPPGNDAHSAWSRGGEICVMRADGSDLRVLTDDQYEEGTPTWVAVLSKGGPH